MEVTKDSFQREAESTSESEPLTLKSASTLLGIKDDVKENLVKSNTFSSVLELLCDKLSSSSSKTKVKVI